MNRMVYAALLMCAAFCIGCSNSSNQHDNQLNSQSVAVEKLKYEILTDSLYSQFPGNFFLTDRYLVWGDGFNSPIVHFLDKHTGKEIASALECGQGPDEFITPSLSSYNSDTLFIWDMNEPKQMLLSMDDSGNFSLQRFEMNRVGGDYHSMIKIPGNQYIIEAPMEIDHPFLYVSGSDTLRFGKFPIEGNFSLGSKFNFLQMQFCFSRKNNMLVCCSSRFHYIAIYKFDGKDFNLAFVESAEPDYTVSDGNLIITNVEKPGFRGLCISGKYIATIEYDFDEDIELAQGRDLSKLPHCVFLRDFSGKLLRKIDFEVPVYSIAGGDDGDILYAILVPDEYVIAKLDL